MPNTGDELHHFGWNACSSCLCPNAPHPHVERRYLVVPGLRSSRIHIIDTKPDPRQPQIVKVIEPEEVAERDRLLASAHHPLRPGRHLCDGTWRCRRQRRPAASSSWIMKASSCAASWEIERGPQRLAYDAWWHLGYDTLVTSEWGTPDTFENGLVPEILLGAKYGRRLHFWDLNRRKHLQEIDFGAEYQLVFELRPAHDPRSAYGFVNAVISLKDLSSSIWTWYRDERQMGGAARSSTSRPSRLTRTTLPDMLKGFAAVPPLVTDIDLSMDDRFLYVSCWGTGDFQQYDVSDPFNPKLTGKVRIGGIVSRATHPAAEGTASSGRAADG